MRTFSVKSKTIQDLERAVKEHLFFEKVQVRVRSSKIEVRCASACETIIEVRVCVRHTVKFLATQGLANSNRLFISLFSTPNYGGLKIPQPLSNNASVTISLGLFLFLQLALNVGNIHTYFEWQKEEKKNILACLLSLMSTLDPV